MHYSRDTPIRCLCSLSTNSVGVSSTIVKFCENIHYRYGFILRQKFPDLVIKHTREQEWEEHYKMTARWERRRKLKEKLKRLVSWGPATTEPVAE